MRTGKYWTGQIPDSPMPIEVMNQEGRTVNLTPYEEIVMHMVDSRGDKVDLSGGEVIREVPENGLLSFQWPRDRSLFTRPGEYVFQIELIGEDSRDFTSQFTILVREFGEVLRK